MIVLLCLFCLSFQSLANDNNLAKNNEIANDKPTDQTENNTNPTLPTEKPQLPGDTKPPAGVPQVPGDIKPPFELPQLPGDIKPPFELPQLPGDIKPPTGLPQLPGDIKPPTGLPQLPGGATLPFGPTKLKNTEGKSRINDLMHDLMIDENESAATMQSNELNSANVDEDNSQ